MVYNALQLLFPCHCLLCLAPSHHHQELCAACRDELPWLGHCCLRCALPLNSPDARLCGHCLRRPPRFEHCLSALRYQFPCDQLLVNFKYHRQLASGRLLAQLWLQHCRDPAGSHRPQLLVPIPLHWRRRWTRGYNQSLLLAQHWGDALSLPVCSALRRGRHTPPQQGLNAAQRRRNLRDAFTLQHPSSINGRHIAVVDDVLTTGTTANAAAAILLAAGARRVDIWCLARTPEPGQ